MRRRAGLLSAEAGAGWVGNVALLAQIHARATSGAPAAMARSVRLFVLVAGALLIAAATPFLGPETLSVRAPFTALAQHGADAARLPPAEHAPDGVAADGLATEVLARQAEVFWKLRVPRCTMAFCAGAALALCGAAFQAMFRNPLAEPYTLGVASGAALGAAVAVHAAERWIAAGAGPGAEWAGGSLVSAAAFVGAAAIMLALLGIGRTQRGLAPGMLLLCGVALSFCCSSVILLLQYLGDPASNFRLLRWVMGQLDSVCGWSDVLAVAGVSAAGAVFVFSFARELNLLSTGDELAASRGVELLRVRQRLVLVVSLLVGMVVAQCGPIGFVGLIVPHCARLLIGHDHRLLLPAAALGGGAFLTVCDTAARSFLAPAELPVGILTALLGGPFFLSLLLSRRATRWAS